LPAKWQTWMPFHINEWKSDVDILALSAAAYRAHSYLLMTAWRQEDGMLPDDNTFLANHSQMFGRWLGVRDEVLELFKRDGDRLYSPRTIASWRRNKAVFERQSAGGRTTAFIKGPRKPRIDRRPEATLWRIIRTRIFQRDNYTCIYCKATACALECDHVIPVSRGGSNDDDNLATACKPCNRSKGTRTVEEWRACVG
jgi:uncharacterized protein YdaU (DUF1376 family)